MGVTYPTFATPAEALAHAREMIMTDADHIYLWRMPDGTYDWTVADNPTHRHFKDAMLVNKVPR